MENLNDVRNLKKLYLGQNSVSVVEGLDATSSLEELHIESQQLLPGETVYFDPRTINNLSKCLRILDISGNNICSISDLRDLYSIEKLNASNNALSDLAAVCSVIRHWPNIQVLDFRRNMIVRETGYRNKVIASTRYLETLDSKDITDITRSFIHRFELIKEERKDKLMKDNLDQAPFSDDVASIAEHLPPGLRHAVSASVQKEALPRATSLTLSLMQVPIKSAGLLPNDSIVGGAGLHPRPGRKVSHAESVMRNRQKVERLSQTNLPQLGEAIPTVLSTP